MLITEMPHEMCVRLLQKIRFGHLACCKHGQPYIVPISFGHCGNHLYCCSTVGRKIEWMRDNPLVCLEVDEIVSRQDWQTVIVAGTYEELPDRPDTLEARIVAHELLADEPNWWQPALAPTALASGERPIRPLLFRIAIREMTGHRTQVGAT